MNRQNTAPVGRDLWSEWLLQQRHAGDPEYERVVRKKVERIRDRVLDAAHLAAEMTIADVGTGDGLIAFGAIARIGSSLRAVLTDVSEPLLKHTEQVAGNLGIVSQCKFLQGSAEAIDGLKDSSIDVAMMRAVLAYVTNKQVALKELHRVLKPGGRISLAEPIFRDQAIETIALTKNFCAPTGVPSKDFLHLVQKWKSAQFPSTEEEMALSPIANFSERDLVRFAREAGFVDIHLELHVDVTPSSVNTWEVFLGTSPHPLSPRLRDILETRFLPEEQTLFEKVMRPLVESGKTFENDAVAYLTGVKP